jgi:hypothetical protein
LELTQAVSSRTAKTGDTISLRLAAPLIVGGRVLLPAGTPATGEVVEAAKPGMGGKAAKLVLAARYLTRHGRRLPLEGLQLARAGKNRTLAASAVGLTGFVFGPLGFVGLAVEGGQVEFPMGLKASARLTDAVTLPSLRRATRIELAQAATAAREARAADEAMADAGSIAIPSPPAGQGEVVFFRRKTILGTGQWFKIREEGKALGKLTNGAYFVHVTTPGVHSYTATFEPELKDHLRLQVDPGETYFVEGTTTKALVIGAADLFPSDRVAFEAAAKHMRQVADLDDNSPEPASRESKAPATASAPTPPSAQTPAPSPAPPSTAAPTPSQPDQKPGDPSSSTPPSAAPGPLKAWRRS